MIDTDGDYTKATLDAYGSKSVRQAAVLSYAVRDVERVKAALNLYLGKTPGRRAAGRSRGTFAGRNPGVFLPSACSPRKNG